MKCPKCENELRSDMFCENCRQYLFNMDKTKKGDTVKSWLKVFGITIGACVLFFIVIIGIVTISDKHASNKQLNTQYEKTYQEFLDENYYSALVDIKKFRNSNDNKKKKISRKYDELYQQIEERIFNDIFSVKDNEKVETLCEYYIEYYSNNKHITKVNEKYSETVNTLAPTRIKEAEQSISNGEYLDADRILGDIVDNDKISEEYVNEAQAIKNRISEIVEYETPVNVSVQDLLASATEYNMRKVRLTTNVVVANIDRERQMLYVCPVSNKEVSGYDYSLAMEIYYGNLSNQSYWGKLSSNDKLELRSVSGRFKIYSNRSNSGYIDAEYIN